MTFVIIAEGEITNPLPDTPVIPDITSDLYFRFKASDLALANGATVESWLGQGNAALANRTLNTATNSNWIKPIYSAVGGPGGRPTVLFNGVNSHLRTKDSDVEAYTGPMTIGMVCSGVTNDTGTNNARFFGSTSTGQLTIQPSAAGNVYSFVAGQDIFSLPNPGGHFALAISLSDTQIIAKTSFSNDIIKLTPPQGFMPTFTGFGIGGSFASTPDNPLNGTVSDGIMFARAMNESDLSALIESLRTENGL